MMAVNQFSPLAVARFILIKNKDEKWNAILTGCHFYMNAFLLFKPVTRSFFRAHFYVAVTHRITQVPTLTVRTARSAEVTPRDRPTPSTPTEWSHPPP